MKKYFLIAALTIFFNKLNAQANFVGATKELINQEFKENKIINTYSEKDSVNITIAICEFYDIAFYFYKRALNCYQVVLTPKDNNTLNELVAVYNKNYVSINSKQWKAYMNSGRVIDIKLIHYNESDANHFVCTQLTN